MILGIHLFETPNGNEENRKNFELDTWVDLTNKQKNKSTKQEETVQVGKIHVFLKYL